MTGGHVILVGAGPGPGLITVRGLRAVQSAEVLVCDDLLDKALLPEAPGSCQIIHVGKRYGSHSASQQEINELLVANAKAGKAVVRLKGGDPFVFGRGGEEIMALQAAGVPYEVIPGVTSAVAVPEVLGIPVTHRGLARSFTVVTGHSADGTGENVAALAGLSGTLVFLMGLHNIETICDQLMARGKDPSTPAAILSRGCSNGQKRLSGTLRDIAGKASEAETPAILVIGPTAGFDLSGTLRLPLTGVSVAVTGTEAFTDQLSQSLTAQGAEVRRLPILELVPEPADIPSDFSRYSWLVFTSGNAVEVFFQGLWARRTDLRGLSRLRFACVGTGTAKRLEHHGFLADFLPATYSGEALGWELPLTEGDRVLLLRAGDGRQDLPSALRQRGADFEDCAIYHTRVRSLDCGGNADYVVFSSGKGVEAYFENGGTLDGAKPVCIGPATAERLRRFTEIPPLVPASQTAEAITRCLMEDCL